MALSADHFYETSSPVTIAFPLTNGVTCYAGSLMGIDDSTGYAVLWADTANYIFAGLALRGATGDTSASPVVDVELNCEGMLLKKVSVTGVTAITNVGDKCYASDDNTFDGFFKNYNYFFKLSNSLSLRDIYFLYYFDY